MEGNGTLTLATWNVNSIKARLEGVTAWLADAKPDIVLLQEIKCETAAFPGDALEELGYNVAVSGQRSYNGVAILSKRPFDAVRAGLAGDDADEQARCLEADTAGLTVAALYVPNGNPVGDDGAGPKYAYKLAWMERLRRRAMALLESGTPFVLGGDFNVIPQPEDARNPAAWEGDALFRAETRASYRRLLNLGLVDAFRALHDEAGAYTFWDYQGGAWQMDNGIRIDHFLLSPEATDRLTSCQIDRAPRGRPKASDHTPVVMTLRAS